MVVTEEQRLKTLQSYRIVDSAPDRAYSDLVVLASVLCETPVAAVSFADQTRHWFKASVGLDVQEIARPSTLSDAFPDLCFESIIPLLTPEGFEIGNLIVADRKPRELNATQIECLHTIGRQIQRLLEFRRQEFEMTAPQVSVKKAKLEFQMASTLLRQTEELYRSTFELANVGIILVEPTGRFLKANPKYLQIVGYSEQELMGKTVFDLTHPEDAPRDRKAAETMIEGHSNYYTIEKRYIRKDGSVVWASISATLMRDENSGQKYFLTIILDITDRKQAEQKLSERQQQILSASKMSTLGEMSGAIAHEINNPLAVIQCKAMEIRMISAEDKLDTKGIRDAAEKIETTVQRISKIIRSLRSFVRQSQQDPFESKPVATIIEDTAELCRPRLRSQAIQLIIEPSPSALVIECRPVEISQVLINLINNAYDAVETRPTRWIQVACVDRDDRIEISVTDSGGGVPEEIRDKILLPFFTTKAPGKGTGLGLSLSKSLVEGHGGRLELDASGANTRFIVKLPKRQQHA